MANTKYMEIKQTMFMKLVPQWDLNKLKVKFASDMCMVPALINEDGSAADVTEDMLAEWGVTVEEFKADALANMKENWEYEIARYFKSHDGDVKLPVISSKYGKFGSTVVMLDEAMDKLRGEIGMDFIFMPTSMHDMVAIRKGDDLDSVYAHTIIDLIMNQDYMDPKYLSTQVFEYITEKGGLCIRNAAGEPVRVSEYL